MSSFDFITNEAMRDSLESDMRELEGCLAHGNLKAVHVLAGSVVEAILIDHLIVANIVDDVAGLKLDLAEAVKRCKENAIITERTADMCSVVRSYRNLIHPGRVIRLGEKVSAETAQVARALVGIVLDEVSSVRLRDYGPTAEQIVSKLERDASVDVITPHLLKKAHKRELERLLIQVLPAAERRFARYEDEPPPAHIFASLSSCFRHALELVDEGLRKKVAARFAAILRSEADEAIRGYGEHFFRAQDITGLADDDAALVKDHLFGQLAAFPSEEALHRLNGIGPSLKPADAVKLVDPIARAVTRQIPTIELKAAVSFLDHLRIFTNSEIDKALTKRLDMWKRTVEERGNPEATKAIAALIGAIDNIPF